MHERPAKLSPLATVVVWGSRRLTLGEKVVWYRDWTFDRGGPDGSYISARSMSESLGASVTPGSVDVFRSRLAKLGLQVAFKRLEGRNPGRVCTLPGHCARPRSWSEATQFSAQLDAHIDGLERGPTLQQSLSTDKTVLNTGSGIGAEGPSGGVGGAPFSKLGETQLPSGVSSTEKGSEEESGVFTPEDKKRGGDPEQAGDIAQRLIQRRRPA